MPKTAVQTPICDICGADVREGSLFCYNCGGSLKRTDTEIVPRPQAAVAPPASANGAAQKVAVDKRAARRRNIDRGPVEVVWEPRQGISIGYVIAGVVLLFIALILFIAAMWLK